MWVRLNEKSLKNTGGKALAQRVYGWDGNPWPRLVLSIYQNNSENYNGYQIGISRKMAAGKWWNPVPLPQELLAELCALLTEIKDRFPLLETAYNPVDVKLTGQLVAATADWPDRYR